MVASVVMFRVVCGTVHVVSPLFPCLVALAALIEPPADRASYDVEKRYADENNLGQRDPPSGMRC